jgi:hypothetical protein
MPVIKNRLFILICFVLSLKNIGAQAPFGNEWIDVAKPHYKFSVVTNGVYRIPYSFLSTNCPEIANAANSEICIFNNGKQIPIHLSWTSSPAGSDFIEFIGTRLDGQIDKKLYIDSQLMLNPFVSLFRDTNFYILTIRPGINARWTPGQNDTNSISSPYLTSFLSKEIFSPKTNYNEGKRYYYTNVDFLFASNYEIGEGWGITAFNNQILNTSNVVNDPNIPAKLRLHIAGRNEIQHKLEFRINNTKIGEGLFLGSSMLRTDLSFPSNLITSNSSTIGITPLVPSNHGYNLGFLELTYPRNFNMNGRGFSYMYFTDDIGSRKFEISGYHSTNAVYLYDLTRYTRLVHAAGTSHRFVIPSSISSEPFILSHEGIATSLTTVQKINLNPISARGNFIIIADRNVSVDSNGVNVIDDYKTYKESPEGGGFKVAVVYTDEIQNHFGFGMPKHPIGIRKFLQWAKLTWGADAPNYALLLGKGFTANTMGTPNQNLYNQNLIPSYGHIGSDYMYTTMDSSILQYMPLGRISATNGQIIRNYLNKLKSYNTEYNASSLSDMTPAKKEYMKWAIHLGGGQGTAQQGDFRANLKQFETIFKDTSVGGNVFSVFKNNPDLAQTVSEVDLAARINLGVGLITFFGHSSATIFDVGLSDPNFFTNFGKYPIILANGCNAGFYYSTVPGYSENFVNLPNRGAIAFVATTNFSLDGALYQYCSQFYQQMTKQLYPSSIGNLVQRTSQKHLETYGYNLNSMNTLSLEYNINGDPSVLISHYPKPDYYIDQNSILLPKQNINTSMDSFEFKVIVQNLGKAIQKNISLSIERVNNGNKTTYTKIITAPFFKDTFSVFIPTLDGLVGAGNNTFNIKIESTNTVDEMSEQNNEILNAGNLIIESEEVIPIFPYEYAIVNTNPVKLTSMVTSSFPKNTTYIIHIDTTTNFNSPSFLATKITTNSNVISWTPTIGFNDSLVYYWRITKDSTITSGGYRWSNSSFIYLPSIPSGGWNQSHYFQYLNNSLSNMNLSTSRQLNYVNDVKNIFIRTDGSTGTYEVEWYLNNARQSALREAGRMASGFMVLWINGKSGIGYTSLDTVIGSSTWGSYGSIQFGYPGLPREGFVFPDTGFTPANHPRPGVKWSTILQDFVNLAANGDYLFFYTIKRPAYQSWDPSLISLFNGAGMNGLSLLTDTTVKAPFIFGYRKNDPSFPPSTFIGTNYIAKTTGSFNIRGQWLEGEKTSVKIGPARKWNTLSYRLSPSENPSQDSISVTLFGYTSLYNKVPLATFHSFSIDTTLDWVNPSLYSNLQLKYYAKDSRDRTPAQLNFWRVYYDEIGEVAVNNVSGQVPNNKDTIENGELYEMNYAVEALNAQSFDSLSLRVQVTQGSKNKSILVKQQPVGGNKLVLNTQTITSSNYFEGENQISYEINPTSFAYQKEKFNINNYGKTQFFVKSDIYNPLLDVTFDGTHIIQNELISNNPSIRIVLKDENKYLLLDDTALIKISLRIPDGSVVPISFSQADVRYTLATSANNNRAEINYKPLLTDGLYQLIIEDKDRSGNSSSRVGSFNYKTGFRVITKNQMSQVFNYPNPFTTSTQFVFTLTGSKIPDYISIQIMNIRGQVVREISKEELGPLKFGLNRTAYAWNGKDQFGDQLANGVYLYRVIVKNEGKDFPIMETADFKALYENQKDLSKYFTDGWGKMVLIR